MSEIKNLLAKMINKINSNEDRIENIEENGAGGGVSSWNDLTDKPFYTTIENGVILEETVFEGFENGGYTGQSNIPSFEEGCQYIVTWDGTEYTCNAFEFQESIFAVGNALIFGGTDTGEPFFMASYDGNILIGAILDTTSTSHTIKITGMIPTVVKIDEKYLPTLVGKNVSGQEFTLTNGKTDIAKVWAEVFNNPQLNTAIGAYSHAEGYSTRAYGDYSHAEGSGAAAHGEAAHAEGNNSHAGAEYAHAEGYITVANGESAHAEGKLSESWGLASHAEGGNSYVGKNAEYAHAEGYNTRAYSAYQHVQGKYNVVDSDNKYAHVVGNGESDANRSNAHTLDWDGNAWFAGSVEGTSMIVKSSTEGSTKRFKITVDDNGTISATEVTTQ